MSERQARATAGAGGQAGPAGRVWWFESPDMWWLAVPAIGVPVVWWSMGVSFVLGTWAAGRPMGWPGAMEMLRAVWGVARGRRLDEAWLLAGGGIEAIATAWWLAVFAVLAVAVPVALGALAVEWRSAGWPMPSMPDGVPAGLLAACKSPDRPERDFIRRRWPVPAPYDYRCPGPGVLIGRYRRRHLVSADGLPVLVVGSTGAGKTRRFLGPNTAHYPGPVVATSVKQDLAELTLEHRKSKGKVYGFEPTGRLHGWMAANGITPVSWDPVRYMAADPTRENADMLSHFLAGQASAAGQGSQAVWPNLVQAALSDMLLIASEIGAPLSTVIGWMTKLSVFADIAKDAALRRKLSPEAREALDQLASDAQKDSRIAGSIEATAHELTRSLKWTAKAGSKVAPVPVDVTVNGGSDTLLLIADHSSQSTHEALFGAVLRHLFHVAETAVLDPDVAHTRPMFALDEFANLARLNDMPKLISTIRSRAQVIIGIQTPAQLAASWGKEHATTIMDNCAVKVVLPGSSDSAALQTFVTLTDDDDDKSAVATAASWRMIEDGYAMAVAGNRKPFKFQLADADRWLDAPDDAEDPGEADGPQPQAEGPPEPTEQAPGGAPDGARGEVEPAETPVMEDAVAGAGGEKPVPEDAGRLFEYPPEAPGVPPYGPPYELLYESPDVDALDRFAGASLLAGIDRDELAEAHENIRARLARAVPFAEAAATADDSGDPGDGDGGGYHDDGYDDGASGAGEARGAGGWVPPPVLEADNALGISVEGVEERRTEAAPQYEMLTFEDADGAFGLHPSGCVVDLADTQQEEVRHGHELCGV